LRSTAPRPLKLIESLGNRVEHACSEAISSRTPVTGEFEIKNTDRAVGAGLAGVIARCYGDAGLPERTVDLRFKGSAGQSFGAFNIAGVRLTLIGEANGYVGKGMSGGEIIIRPPAGSRFDWSKNVIAGNTVMYGATGGALFAAGRAGERFCVRNSGGIAVVEGVGDHGCEYMTAGLVVVLGEVGRNFAAGMTGGTAYVFDEQRTFQKRCNTELVSTGLTGDRESRRVRSLVERHYDATHSPRARYLLSSWQSCRKFLLKIAVQTEQAPESATQTPRVSVAAKLDTQTFVAAD
jgi:glutamate synthase (ferredoxin)